jgi:hypothetical protein
MVRAGQGLSPSKILPEPPPERGLRANSLQPAAVSFDDGFQVGMAGFATRYQPAPVTTCVAIEPSLD